MDKLKQKLSLAEFKIPVISVIIIQLALINIYAQDFLNMREKTQLVNWKFHKGEIYRAESRNIRYTDAWEDVTVPHTWNARDVLTKGSECYQGPGWYRAEFDISLANKKARHFIRFEGVCLVTDVYMNGKYVGRHKGGYSAFCFEITRYIEEGKNIIAVKADNTMQPDVAPSGIHLYPLFGGIYRPVTVFSANEICISPMDYASGGVYIHQKNISDKEAYIAIETLLDYRNTGVFRIKSPELLPPPGKTGKSISALVRTSVTDRKGNMIEQEKDTVEVTDNTITRSIQEFHIQNPHLWNARIDPYLYTLNVQVEDLQGNILDEAEQKFGLRYFKVDKQQGLLLNGRPYHLYGVCRHQEWEGLGPALLDKHHEKDIELIMEVGANGVRLAHYQQADKMYSLCDEKGLVVWAEIPNTPSYRLNTPSYLQNCKNQLTELIKQNYNHPSILFWGMYNEIGIPVKDLKVLHETAKELDPYRLTTQADFSQVSEKHYVTDIAAWNWYFGWYYGQFDDYGKWYGNLHAEHPDMIAGLSEYGAGASISQQQENPERPDPANGRFFPEQYQRLYHEKVWSDIKDRRDIWCKFIWNMFDFSWTVVKRGDRDFINHKGLITHDRKTKKDAFYYYKANWSDEPVLYILSRRNTRRTENIVPVELYTNLDEVELYVNGVFLSKKKTEPGNHKIIWENIKLLPGRNQISVIGYKAASKYTDSCEWIYYQQ